MNEMKYPVLLVEDDSALSFIVKDNLEQHQYRVEVAADGAMALEMFRKNNYAIILLDVMLPKLDGFNVAKEIRKTDEQVPIIFLTARSMTEDKITGLTLGGDDYVTKPFSLEELLLKMRIFLKRSTISNAHQTKPATVIGDYVFIEEELLLKHSSLERRLTLKEAELIRLFTSNINHVLSRDEILTRVWGSNDYFLGRSLDVFISRLRKYFRLDPKIRIVNLHGIGFRFSLKED